MNYALALPTGGECGDPRFLVELAERAEGFGWNGVFLEDYVWYQGDAAAPTCDVFQRSRRLPAERAESASPPA